MGHYGIVYITSNDKHHENVYKIGGTSRNVAERMSELNRETGTFGRFQPKAFFPVNDWEQAEAACHLKLAQYREDKEFFIAPYDELVTIVRGICEQYPPRAYAPETVNSRLAGMETELTDNMLRALDLTPEEITAYRKAELAGNEELMDDLLEAAADRDQNIREKATLENIKNKGEKPS